MWTPPDAGGPRSAAESPLRYQIVQGDRQTASLLSACGVHLPECEVFNLRGDRLLTARLAGVSRVLFAKRVVLDGSRGRQPAPGLRPGVDLQVEFFTIEGEFYRFVAPLVKIEPQTRLLLLEVPHEVQQRVNQRAAFRVEPTLSEPVRVRWPVIVPVRVLPSGGRSPLLGDRAIDVSVTGLSFNSAFPLERMPLPRVIPRLTVAPPQSEGILAAAEIVNARRNPVTSLYPYRIGVRLSGLTAEGERALSRYIYERQRQTIRGR